MNNEQFEIIRNSNGFIAALDQSGGSTPKALKAYGINEDEYSNEEEMFELVHKMRTRIIKSKAFDNRIIGVILFKQTINSKIDGEYTADYLWNQKHVVPFLKIDSGLAEVEDGVALMKEIKNFDEILKLANERNIFGTKMRSVIYTDNKESIKKVVKQQFEFAKKILSYNLIPIVEPEVDINLKQKDHAEEILKKYILEELNQLKDDEIIILKLTIPTTNNKYSDLIAHKNVLRVVALSGGYTINLANEKLSQNHGLIASFSRALVEGITSSQSEEDFDKVLNNNIQSIYDASIK